MGVAVGVHLRRVTEVDNRVDGDGTAQDGVVLTGAQVGQAGGVVGPADETSGAEDRRLLYGVSWGSTLILAYAQTHPERVTEAVISSVTTTRRSEIDWLYRGAGQIFPEAWHTFRASVPEATGPTGLVTAYAHRMESPDPAVRERATAAWCAWEDAVLSMEAAPGLPPYSSRPGPAQQALVRICAHYFSHGAWLRENQLIDEAHRLTGIPAALIHGRFDLGGPLITAWELDRAWPDAELTVIANAGHLGGPATKRAVLAALDGFAAA
ncbi:alpha/beta fold hydrolase [Streptomyces microflavus]|uniref:alpha/beta fold hydrolase n=1 Tax=Streptomyces microflavus TaxID=1919 RepID=UPI003452F1D8